MTNGEVERDWKAPLLRQEVIARAKYIATLEESADDQLNLAKAYLASLFGAVHGPGFARRIAWAMSDEHDEEKLRAAAVEKGIGMVVRSIISQTNPIRAGSDEAPGPLRLVVWVLLAEGSQEEDLVIIERASNSVHRQGEATIRRRLPEDPDEWFRKP